MCELKSFNGNRIESEFEKEVKYADGDMIWKGALSIECWEMQSFSYHIHSCVISELSLMAKGAMITSLYSRKITAFNVVVVVVCALCELWIITTVLRAAINHRVKSVDLFSEQSSHSTHKHQGYRASQHIHRFKYNIVAVAAEHTSYVFHMVAYVLHRVII